MFRPRSEEEKTQDILFHEKRSGAQDHVDAFSKIYRRALLITCIAAVVLFCALCPLMLAAYDSQRLWLLAAVIALYGATVVLAWFVSGAVLCRSLGTFVRWSALRSKWIDVLQQMDRVEEEFLRGNIYEEDVKKTEQRMARLADEIHAWGEKNEI